MSLVIDFTDGNSALIHQLFRQSSLASSYLHYVQSILLEYGELIDLIFTHKMH